MASPLRSTSDPPLLAARMLTKRYGSVLAVDSLDLEIRSGEVVALIGDNGAGKSTVIKMLSGAVSPDSGEIQLQGSPVAFDNPQQARRSGIETVWQELALPPRLDVAGNLYIGRELVYPGLPRIVGLLNRRAMRRGARERLDALGITLPEVAGMPAAMLSGGQRQAVAIARATAWATEVLFMDEPTAALGVKQSTATLELARRLAGEGLGVAFITHTLPHVMSYADRIVVLRRGRKVADLIRSEATPDGLVSLMVGFEPGTAVATSDSDDSG